RARLKLDAVLNQLPVAVVIVDKDGHTVLNDQVRVIYGTALRTINRKDYQPSVITHRDGRAYTSSEVPVARAVVARQIVAELLQIDRPDGSRRTVSVNAGPVRDESGEIASAVAAFSDVTEELRVADQLRIGERRYHAVLRATNDVIWELDLKTG